MKLNRYGGLVAGLELSILASLGACQGMTQPQAEQAATRIEAVAQPAGAVVSAAVPPPWGVPLGAAIIGVGHLAAELLRSWNGRANPTRTPQSAGGT